MCSFESSKHCADPRSRRGSSFFAPLTSSNARSANFSPGYPLHSVSVSDLHPRVSPEADHSCRILNFTYRKELGAYRIGPRSRPPRHRNLSDIIRSSVEHHLQLRESMRLNACHGKLPQGSALCVPKEMGIDNPNLEDSSFFRQTKSVRDHNAYDRWRPEGILGRFGADVCV